MLNNQRIEYIDGLYRVNEEIVSLNDDVPGIILECSRSGLCGTDVRMIRKERECNASIIGHEAATYVIAHNSKKITSVPGQRVFLNPNPPQDKQYLGHLGHDRDGLFQKYIWLSEDDYFAYALDIVPSCLDDNQALTIEPLSCGWHTLSKFQQHALSKMKHGIFGAGTLAIVHIHLLKMLGAETDNMCVFNRSSTRGLDVSQRTGVPKEHCYAAESIPDRMEGELDLVLLINSNANRYIADALKVVKDGGIVVVFGGIANEAKIKFDEGEVDLLQVRLQELSVNVHLHGKAVNIQGTRGFSSSDTMSLLKTLEAAGNAYPSLTFQEHSPWEFANLLNRLRADDVEVPLGKQICKFG